jgi:hypothetical protein
MRAKRCGLCLLIALTVGCTEVRNDDVTDARYSLGPIGGGFQPGRLLVFPQLVPGSVVETEASFWAVKGQTRTLVMHYAPNPDGSEGERLLEFVVPAHGLLFKPNGSFFHMGDSILITVKLDPAGKLSADFQPSNLVFNPLNPARLSMSYLHTDPDFDGDGDEDLQDALIALDFGIWKQEFPGLPWLPLPTLRIGDFTLRARVLSFTGFAMASN